jgi:hypothetical protein
LLRLLLLSSQRDFVNWLFIIKSLVTDDVFLKNYNDIKWC